jgi:DNA-binding MarR family transcriptional regulator
VSSDGTQPPDPPTSLLFDIFALNQSLGRMLSAYMADSPLTPAEYAFYSAIFETESITPSALAKRLGMPLTTVMDHVARLELKRHISRWPDPADRRATRIVLTAGGLAAHRAANASFEHAYKAFDAALGTDEAIVQNDLAHVRAAVEEAARAAPHGLRPSARHRAAEAPRPARTRVRARSRR